MSTWDTSETHNNASTRGADNMLQPPNSRIVEVRASYPCSGHCKRPGVIVVLERPNGERIECWTHDDGSFVEWMGETESGA